jgi:hypothetical protein
LVYKISRRASIKRWFMGWWGKIGAGLAAAGGAAAVVVLAPLEIAIAAGALGTVAVVGAVGYAVGDSGREEAEKRTEEEKRAHLKTAAEAKTARENFDKLKDALEPRLKSEVAMIAIFGVLTAALHAANAMDDSALDSAQSFCFGDFMHDINGDLLRRVSKVRNKPSGIRQATTALAKFKPVPWGRIDDALKALLTMSGASHATKAETLAAWTQASGALRPVDARVGVRA